MATPELYDQEGFIIRIGVGGALRWGDVLVRARDISVVVNDDYWKGVQFVEAKSTEVLAEELGHHRTFPVPAGARGSIEILGPRDDEAEPVRRFQALTPDSVVAIVAREPGDGPEIRRITFHGCRWSTPSVVPRDAGNRLQVGAEFKAEWFEDQ